MNSIVLQNEVGVDPKTLLDILITCKDTGIDSIAIARYGKKVLEA